jgi:hypothetical protein
VKPSSLEEVHLLLRMTFCLHLQGREGIQANNEKKEA